MKFQVISQSNMKYAKEIFENKFMALEITPPPPSLDIKTLRERADRGHERLDPCRELHMCCESLPSQSRGCLWPTSVLMTRASMGSLGKPGRCFL